MRRLAGIFGAVVLGLSLFTFTATAVPKCSRGHPENCPTPTPTPVATPTPTPTATPIPTPTATPTTTPTPVPTPTATPTQTYTLDLEFNDSTIDSRLVPLWSPTDPGDRLDSDSQRDVTIAQTTQANGILSLAVERKQTPSGRPFAGATWSTYGTFGQRYGTFEARIRYDENKGTWPSLWLLPVGQKGPYPEIDMFESYGDTACLGPGYTENVVHHAGETVSDYVVVPLANSSGWHVHKIIWSATRVDFYIDGVNTFSVTTNVPQVPMYPIFTAGVGANNPNCRADFTTPDMPHAMDIDYLRITGV